MLTLVMGAGQTASATSMPDSCRRSISPKFSPSVWQRIRMFLGPRTSLAFRIQGTKCWANIGGKVSMSSKFDPHWMTSAGDSATMRNAFSYKGARASAR